MNAVSLKLCSIMNKLLTPSGSTAGPCHMWHPGSHASTIRAPRSRTIARIHKALNTQVKESLETPEEVTLEALTLLRKPYVESLGAYLVPVNPSSSAPLVRVGPLETHETGPLALWAGRLDGAARRLLPRHLLRRCRILSSLPLGTICRQRVAITGWTGEEAVFAFELVKDMSQASASSTSISRPELPILQPEQPEVNHPYAARASPDGSATSDDEGPGSRQPATLPSVWKISQISRDTSEDLHDPPSGPHPRLPPELIIVHQLRELSSGNLQAAAAYMAQAVASSVASAQVELRSLVRTSSHHLLLTHHSFELLEGAAPADKQYWQHVRLRQSGYQEGHAVDFVWKLSLNSLNGCWLIDMIEPCGG